MLTLAGLGCLGLVGILTVQMDSVGLIISARAAICDTADAAKGNKEMC